MSSGNHIDLTSQTADSTTPPETKVSNYRPYIGIFFGCCAAYARIYRNAEGTEYSGHCPRCLQLLRVKIDF